MPTVLRSGGLRIAIYANDHRPAHVHVIGADGEAVFDLHCPTGPVELREVYGFSSREAGRIAAIVSRSIAVLCKEWEKLHGSF